MNKKYFNLTLCAVLVFIVVVVILGNLKISVGRDQYSSAEILYEGWWEVQSVDTMKYSRDLAREKMDDENFEKTIEYQISQIANLGATHVAIGTPYDSEFLPFLNVWIEKARNYNLNVWFRGNFSGWEGWFNYPKITPQQHIKLTGEFILNNENLFEDGDIFTSCTECENGAIGDPRYDSEADDFRQFIIEEYKTANQAFEKIGKKVHANYYSMNGDVSKLIMDKQTTNLLGGLAVVDHYVNRPEQLAYDVSFYSSSSGGNIVLGELGVPIPDIHGIYSEDQQADWLKEALSLLANKKELTGVNYWVFSGGSTGLWDDGGNKKKVADTLQEFYKPKKIRIKVINQLGNAVSKAVVHAGRREFVTNDSGFVDVLIVPGIEHLDISSSGYKDRVVLTNSIDYSTDVTLDFEEVNIIYKILHFIKTLR